MIREVEGECLRGMTIGLNLWLWEEDPEEKLVRAVEPVLKLDSGLDRVTRS